MMQHIAIYDMDKTITRKATFGPFLFHAALKRNPARLMLFPLFGAISSAHLALARLKLHRGDYRKAAKVSGLTLVAGAPFRAEQADALGKSFAADTLLKNSLPGALAQIEADRAAGYRLVLASASNRLYVAAIAEALGFEVAICTENHVCDEGLVHARIPGDNCYGATKLRLIENWMAGVGVDRADAHIRFYSDHVTDAPCMEWADEAFATNPHPPLRKLARKRGWPVLDWA
jgi:HAD superfamily hydrolase (TIGR01490 family)